ncbi:hypothetical protein [Acidithiobacillus ferrooxidans]|uniref:hypothetical protein n=1 Tax=Acidithiobacillus ferrooxidans TaxID=920 RepID=UPI000AF9B4E9|nr:hypothetical protein [Acidithiobacillus ferrooxidans]
MTTAADFVYEHLGRLLERHAPANPKDKWRTARVDSCDACGESDDNGRHKDDDHQAVCNRCYTFYRQSPFFCEIGTRFGSLREGGSYAFAIVKVDETLLYVTTKPDKKLTFAHRLEYVRPMVEAAPELRRVRYRPLSAKWDDMMSVKPPYVAFVVQGKGNSQALAAALVKSHVQSVRGQLRWLNKDGSWISLSESLVRQALELSAQMGAEKKTFLDRVIAQWESLALGLPLQWNWAKLDEPEITTTLRKYPLLDQVMQTSPMFRSGLKAITEIVKTGAEE